MTQPLGAAVLAPDRVIIHVEPNTETRTLFRGKINVHLRLPTNEVCVRMASIASWQYKYFRVIKCVVPHKSQVMCLFPFLPTKQLPQQYVLFNFLS